MPAVTLKQQVQPIAKVAITVTFQGQTDENSLATKFADKFSTGFANAIYSYVGMCIAPPIGGPIIAASTSKLKQDLIQTAKDAIIAMFQGESDDNNIADRFSKPFGNFAMSMASYMPTCIVTPSAPPVIPLTPGNFIVCPPSTVCVPSMYQAAYQGMTDSFQDESDDMQLANLFATQMQNIGNCIQPYVLTCAPLPGGGNLPAK